MAVGSDVGGMYGLIKGQFDVCREYADSAFKKVAVYLDTLTQIAQDPAAFIGVVDYVWPEPIITNPPWLNRPVRPNIPLINQPELNFNFTEIPYTSELFDVAKAKLIADIQNGGTGLSPYVEQALWDRARARMMPELARARDQAENSITARGWELPSGALQAMIAEAVAEEVRMLADLNDKIMIAQGNLAQQNTQFAITAGINLEGQSREYANQVVNRALEKAKSIITSATEIFKAYAEYIGITLDVYKSDVQAYEADTKAAALVLEPQVEIFKGRIQRAKNETDLLLKAAEINLAAFTTHKGLLLEVAKGGASVYAQLAASALNAMHASASLGFTGNIGTNESVSKAESYSTQVSYQHTYKE